MEQLGQRVAEAASYPADALGKALMAVDVTTAKATFAADKDRVLAAWQQVHTRAAAASGEPSAVQQTPGGAAAAGRMSADCAAAIDVTPNTPLHAGWSNSFQ